MIYCNHGPKRDFLNANFTSSKTGIMFSAPKLSRELNKLLQWETYNPLPKLNNNSLTIFKIVFYAFWKRFGLKTRSSKQLKIAVLNRRRRRFRPDNNVLRAKVIELTEMIYCNHDHLDGDLTSYQDGNHVFGAQTIEMNEITCCNEKPISFFQTKLQRSYNNQNRVLRVLEAIWA